MLDGTAEIRGVTLGQGVYKLTNWPLGVMDTAGMRVNDLARPNRDGLIPGADYYGGRDLSFEVMVAGGSHAATEAAIADLAAAFARSAVPVPIDVRVAGNPGEYRLFGKPRGVVVAFSRQDFTGAAVARCQCHFTATDPVRYSLSESSLVLSLAATGTGLEYPVEYPVVYGGTGGAGQGDAVNGGSADVDWFATFTGPLTNPRIEHVNSGRFMRVVASVAASQTVVLDSTHGAVLLNGSTPRPSWVGAGSSWFRLEAGSNLLRFTADSGSGDCTVVWRSGWA